MSITGIGGAVHTGSCLRWKARWSLPIGRPTDRAGVLWSGQPPRGRVIRRDPDRGQVHARNRRPCRRPRWSRGARRGRGDPRRAGPRCRARPVCHATRSGRRSKLRMTSFSEPLTVDGLGSATCSPTHRTSCNLRTWARIWPTAIAALLLGSPWSAVGASGRRVGRRRPGEPGQRPPPSRAPPAGSTPATGAPPRTGHVVPAGRPRSGWRQAATGTVGALPAPPGGLRRRSPPAAPPRAVRPGGAAVGWRPDRRKIRPQRYTT